MGGEIFGYHRQTFVERSFGASTQRGEGTDGADLTLVQHQRQV